MPKQRELLTARINYISEYFRSIMTIYINREKLRLFRGARVCDAILRYSEQEYRQILARRKQVQDTEGHLIGLQGRLEDGAQINIVATDLHEA